MSMITVAGTEWHAVAELVAPFVYDDEHLGHGHVHLVAEDGCAVWSARGRNSLVSLRTACGEGSVDTLIPPRVIHAAEALAERSGVLTVSADGPGGRLIVGDGATRLELGLPTLQAPDVGGLVEGVRSQPSVDVRVSLQELRDAVEIATTAPTCNQRGDDEPLPLLWMEVSPGRLALTVEWDGMGRAEYSVEARCEGSTRLAVNPANLRRFCKAVDVDEILLRVPLEEPGTLVFETADWVGCTMPIPTGVEQYRNAVEQVLSELFGPQATIRDEDGDYCLPKGRTLTYARLENGPARMQVFAVAVTGVPLTEELLLELNDYNREVSFVRTFWFNDQVLVEGEIMAESVDAEAVTEVCRSVDRVASQTAPILASMFGGTAGPDAPGGSEWFWQRYTETVVAVEATPGTWVDLNGPNFAERLPLGEPLHVLTAWDPGGHPAPRDANKRAQGILVAELWASGCSVARASGRSPDGNHLDEGVAVLGLDRETARTVGARYGQDAVFEFDATTVTLVSCVSERVTTASRFSQLTFGEFD